MCNTQEYIAYMQKAITLAKKGQFLTYPNPNVGALLIKDDAIVAQGYHTAAGMPHAEIECLNDAAKKGIDTKNTVMVVTLEPCKHYGKTPPCVEAIKKAGISTLVYGCTDPNPEARGGAELLASAGIKVIGPVLEQQCKDLIADFTIWQTTKRPYIILKLAATLDGRIATRTGHSRWISNELSRACVHKLRGGIGFCGGCVLIGGGTFRADNPQLTARLPNVSTQPWAAIMTSRLPKADSDFALLTNRPEKTIFFASPAATASTTAKNLRKLGCKVIAIGPRNNNLPDFYSMFQYLREELNCPYVLCEGGGKLALSLLEAGYVDEFHIFIAPIILGDNAAPPLFDGHSPLTLEEALKLRLCFTDSHDGDAHLIYRPI